MSKNHFFKAFFCALLLAAVVTACRDVGFDKENPSEEPFTEGVMRIRYEVETLTFSKANVPDDKRSAIEKVDAEPSARRTFNQLTIFEDGTYEQYTEKKTPANRQLEPRDKTLPDTSEKSVAYKIDRSGTAHFYNKDGKERRTHKMQQVTDYKDFVKLLQDPTKKEVLQRKLQGISDPEVMNKMKDDAIRSGAEVHDFGGGNYSISQITPAIRTSLKENDGNNRVESFINVNHGVMVAQRVYNEQNKLIGRTLYGYEFPSNQAPKLKTTQQETYEVNINGHEVTNTVISNYSGMVIQIR